MLGTFGIFEAWYPFSRCLSDRLIRHCLGNICCTTLEIYPGTSQGHRFLDFHGITCRNFPIQLLHFLGQQIPNFISFNGMNHQEAYEASLSTGILGFSGTSQTTCQNRNTQYRKISCLQCSFGNDARIVLLILSCKHSNIFSSAPLMGFPGLFLQGGR